MSEGYAGERARQEHLAKIEDHIRLRIKPRPIWMPHFLWRWLLGEILVMEYWDKSGKLKGGENGKPES